MNSNTNKLVDIAIDTLKQWQEKGVVADIGTKNFYVSLSQGLCPICKESLEIVKHTEWNDRFSYVFKCGHKFDGISLFDKIKTYDTFGVKQMRKQIGLVLRMFFGYKQSGDPKLSKGVTVNMTVDRENNRYDQKVIDNITGKVIHEEHESLIEHSHKQTKKKD